MAGRDDSARLAEAVLRAYESGGAVVIAGQGSKASYSESASGGDLVSTVDHAGIVDYRPDELVVTARAGTPLKEIGSVLAEARQMLPFDPPQFGGRGTLGGAVATGLSGPGRPWFGSVRDCVLGVEIVNGRGERLHFGGQVMKNVAGYDVARLMVGAAGTLGLVLSVSVRLLPMPESTATLQVKCTAEEAAAHAREWISRPYPVTATCHAGGVLHVRLSGSREAVWDAREAIGFEEAADGDAFWARVRDHEHGFFRSDTPLWRLSLPRGTAFTGGAAIAEWAGAQVWHKADQAGPVEALARDLGGYAEPFGAVRTPDDPALKAYMDRIKDAFDPSRVLNPGVMA